MVRASLKQNNPLPAFFKPILWSYKFSSVDLDKDKKRIIINAINYGDWEHWLWVFNYYGITEVKKNIENTPVSEFRRRALEIIILLLKIKKIKYANRGLKVRTEKDI